MINPFDTNGIFSTTDLLCSVQCTIVLPVLSSSAARNRWALKSQEAIELDASIFHRNFCRIILLISYCVVLYR